jgi:hypothetical protein
MTLAAYPAVVIRSNLNIVFSYLSASVPTAYGRDVTKRQTVEAHEFVNGIGLIAITVHVQFGRHVFPAVSSVQYPLTLFIN